MLLATGCVTSSPAPSLVDSKADVFCQTQQPLVLNKAAIDALDDQAARDVLSYNEFYAAHCGAKPGATKP